MKHIADTSIYLYNIHNKYISQTKKIVITEKNKRKIFGKKKFSKIIIKQTNFHHHNKASVFSAFYLFVCYI